MITIEDKALCSGCAACGNICPTEAIVMQEDEEGFLYPAVNLERCIKCSKCIKVCPYIKSEFTVKPDSEELSKSYIAYNKDEEIRAQSSSGGMFHAFAKKIISENGIVFGAAFDEKFEVYHKSAQDEQQVKEFMGSKYLQSRMGFVHREVEKELKEGKKVLFTGVACQIAGLKRYLRKDRENLICVDVICCSVGSPKIWREYLKENFQSHQINSVNFRDKISGWDSSSMRIKSQKEDYICCIYNDLYFKSLRSNVFTRQSCGTCKYKNRNRVSDITIADCWGWQELAPEMNDNRGLSSVIIHSKKGEDMLSSLREQIVIKEAKLADIEKYNSNYICPESFNQAKRDNFWEDYKKLSFNTLLNKYGSVGKKEIYFGYLKKVSRIILPKFAKKMIKLVVKKIVYRSAKHILSEDRKFNESFRFNGEKMPRSFKRSPEWQIIVLYRKFQVNHDNIYGKYYGYKLNRQGHRMGVDFEGNLSIGKGLIIGHYGRIVINGSVKFGEQIYITHGVTIGRNAQGRNKGVPTFGNRVRIGANAIIVGNVLIGDDVVIAPGAFVNFDVPNHSVVIGNPGKIHYKDNATQGYLGIL